MTFSKNNQFLFSCEHYSNHVPKEYELAFKKNKKILTTHFAWDIGMPLTIQVLEKTFQTKCHRASFSRLIVDANRSLRHPELFSKFTKSLDKEEKQKILDKFYHPYRDKIETEIRSSAVEKNHTFHIALHSFTPELNQIVRNNDIGILFDPASKSEKIFSNLLKENLNLIQDKWRVRFNYPYLGKADSFPTYLRRKFNDNYSGIELEINQKFFSKDGSKILSEDLIYNLIEALQNTLFQIKDHTTHSEILG